MAATVSYLFEFEHHEEVVPQKPTSKKRNTKAIGDLSELEIAVVLTRAGYIVSKPLGDSHRYDFVIDDGKRLARVQVKTGRYARGRFPSIASAATAIGAVSQRGRTSGRSTSSRCGARKREPPTLSPKRNWYGRRCICASTPPSTDKTNTFGGQYATSWRSLVVKHLHGKQKIVSSILTASSRTRRPLLREVFVVQPSLPTLASSAPHASSPYFARYFA
jgi:hypothetical protein